MSKINKKKVFFLYMPIFFLAICFFTYMRPQDPAKEMISIQKLGEQIILANKRSNDNISTKTINSLIPSRGFFFANKPDDQPTPQSNGNSSLSYSVNNTTRTLYINSNGYDKNFCSDLIGWANPSNVRNSFLSSIFQFDKKVEMKKLRNILASSVKMNDKELTDPTLTCSDVNDITYIKSF